jgi:hypothetical protein
VPPFDAGEAPRRSTSLLEPVDSLPPFWTLPFGFFAGLLVVGRFARWLQVLIALWRGDATQSSGEPRRREIFALVLTSVTHPTPWLVLVGSMWAIHRLIVSPVSPEGWWFIAGFVCGPPITVALVMRRVRQLRLQRAKKDDISAS